MAPGGAFFVAKMHAFSLLPGPVSGHAKSIVIMSTYYTETMRYLLNIFILILLIACNQEQKSTQPLIVSKVVEATDIPFDSSLKTIHVTVALCDNTYQGIVPVSKSIGNGQDPNSNLYWGAAYGIKTWFRRSKDWAFVQKVKSASPILERIIFKHTTSDYYLVADAWDGKYIKDATKAFLSASAGINKDSLHVDGKVLGIDGNAKLVAYIGHDGLMDFSLDQHYANADGQQRDVIILACYSKDYFGPYMKQARAKPLVWTTGLMAPEAYTLHDALGAYVQGEKCEVVRTQAAAAYARYQKCSLGAAKRLLVCE
jgi:hypothetical protein